jgi:hypothetical protein
VHSGSGSCCLASAVGHSVWIAVGRAAELRSDPLHVRSRDKSQRVQTVVKDCAVPLTQEQARHATEVKSDVRMCPNQKSACIFNRTSTTAQNADWLGY